MESCLLCLEINKDILDSINANSKQWQELDITKTIEKHFWSLVINTILPNTWICLSCWREIDAFHKFYLRIEEAHVNFGKIKVEDLVVPVECKEELLQSSIVKDSNKQELGKGNVALCFVEPEILIDQSQTEPEIIVAKAHTVNLVVEKAVTLNEHTDELDLDDMPLSQARKRLRQPCVLTKRDPLEKTRNSKQKKSSKAKVSAKEKSREDIVVKLEPTELKDNDSKFIADDNDASDVNYQPEKDTSEISDCEKDKGQGIQSIKRKENDKFIVEHFKLLGFKFICDVCQVPFEDFTSMQKHFVKDHEQRGYVVCCNRKYYDRSRLVDHLHCHVNPDHFKCNECGKSLSDRMTFQSHMQRVHRADEVVRQHCCDVCGRSFAKSYVLKMHKLTHIPEEEKEFPCTDCGKNYGSPYQLNIHKQAVHLKLFAKICNICGKVVNSNAEFKVHMNKHEGISQPVINCDVCGLRLTSERGLKLHKVSQHPVGGKKEHPCPICPKISPTLTALRKHINTMHIKGYDHKCSICEKAFRKAESLKEHMASHTGTFLYSCPWCPKTFNSNGNMHAHRKNKHPKEYLELKLQKYN